MMVLLGYFLVVATIVVIGVGILIAYKIRQNLIGPRKDQTQQENNTLRQPTTDRFRTSEQQENIRSAIRLHAGQKITVAVVPTAEARMFADQLIELLRSLDWDVGFFDPGFLSPFPTGVLLEISREPANVVKSLVSAFARAGIKPLLIQPEPHNPDFVQLTVGVKFPP